MDDRTRKALQIYTEEARERIDAVEHGLLEMERLGAKAPKDLVNSVFREAHSMKAGANLLGLTNIESLTHRLETVLDELRFGRLELSTHLITDMLEAVDVLKDMLASPGTSQQADIGAADESLAGWMS
ncbi:MAG: Hpt domain-containing protein [Desulfovibrionaceae bacterium]